MQHRKYAVPEKNLTNHISVNFKKKKSKLDLKDITSYLAKVARGLAFREGTSHLNVLSH